MWSLGALRSRSAEQEPDSDLEEGYRTSSVSSAGKLEQEQPSAWGWFGKQDPPSNRQPGTSSLPRFEEPGACAAADQAQSRKGFSRWPLWQRLVFLLTVLTLSLAAASVVSISDELPLLARLSLTSDGQATVIRTENSTAAVEVFILEPNFPHIPSSQDAASTPVGNTPGSDEEGVGAADTRELGSQESPPGLRRDPALPQEPPAQALTRSPAEDDTGPGGDDSGTKDGALARPDTASASAGDAAQSVSTINTGASPDQASPGDVSLPSTGSVSDNGGGTRLQEGPGALVRDVTVAATNAQAKDAAQKDDDIPDSVVEVFGESDSVGKTGR